MAASSPPPACPCATCGERPAHAGGECFRCYSYRLRLGEARPRQGAYQGYDAPMPASGARCSNCGGAPAHSRGRCRACYRYVLAHGAERPR